MTETLQEVMARLERMKHEDGVDELIQHFYWTMFEVYVSMEKIRKGPDQFLTRLSAKINAHFEGSPIAPSSSETIPPEPVAKEHSNARRKRKA